MPVQQGQSLLAAEMGGLLSAAAAEHRDAPIKTGFQRLPGGIKFGIAKLQKFGWFKREKKEGQEGGGKVPVGKMYCQATAAVLYPHEHGGHPTAKMQTSKFIALCATEARPEYQVPAKDFKENFADFISLLKLLSNSTMVCQETPQTDPNGVKAELFYKACMARLTDPKHAPYIVFSTKEMPKKKKMNESEEEFKQREPFVIENWMRVATPEDLAAAGIGPHNPAAGVNVLASPNGQSHPTDAPPDLSPDGLPVNSRIHSMAPEESADEPNMEDVVTELVAVASDDPQGNTPEGQEAHSRLKQLAQDNGWTEQQVDEATTWEQVGDMALNASEDQPQAITVGAKFKYASRDRNGNKVKDKKGEEFPAEEVEITSVDEASQTCTLKRVRDGKDICAVGSRKPVSVKFDWLE